jgi:hypothetical protein
MIESLPSDRANLALEGKYDVCMIGRQFVPAVRTGLLAIWNRNTNLPNADEFAHTMFDICSQVRANRRAILVETITGVDQTQIRRS